MSISATSTHVLKRPGKRLFDILFSASVLLLGSPIYLLLMLLVKCSTPGPIFYKALRMGQHGQLIHCFKFRSMCLDAEERLEKLLSQNAELQDEWNTYHKLRKDPRLTPIGGFLRKSSLDELPQFWNVLKGDLSVVGPRPIEITNPENADREIRGRYRERTDMILSAKPGITCLWQIMGRNELTFEKRALLEVEYVRTQSFWLDVKIICKTVWILVFPKGAY